MISEVESEINELSSTASYGGLSVNSCSNLQISLLSNSSDLFKMSNFIESEQVAVEETLPLDGEVETMHLEKWDIPTMECLNENGDKSRIVWEDERIVKDIFIDEEAIVHRKRPDRQRINPWRRYGALEVLHALGGWATVDYSRLSRHGTPYEYIQPGTKLPQKPACQKLTFKPEYTYRQIYAAQFEDCFLTMDVAALAHYVGVMHLKLTRENASLAPFIPKEILLEKLKSLALLRLMFAQAKRNHLEAILQKINSKPTNIPKNDEDMNGNSNIAGPSTVKGTTAIMKKLPQTLQITDKSEKITPIYHTEISFPTTKNFTPSFGRLKRSLCNSVVDKNLVATDEEAEQTREPEINLLHRNETQKWNNRAEKPIHDNANERKIDGKETKKMNELNHHTKK